MPAFKRFGPGDQIDNVLVLEPVWTLSSGTSGWRGAPEGSASVSLYGGYNRQPGGVVREYAFQRTIQGTDSFGKLSRSEPITASVNFVWMTNEDLNLAQRSSTRWGHEHWKTVLRLYDYYSRRDPDYTTASYDHYVLYFQKDSRNVVALSDSTAQTTGSFTLESWVKPLLTQSLTNDFTIQSRNNVVWLGITGSTGRLIFSSSHGMVTASAGPTLGDWSHVALSYDTSTLSGTFYLNLQQVGTFTMTALTASASATLHTVGNRLSGYGGVPEGSWSTGSLRRSFHGFIGESRVWTRARTYSQISSSYSQRLTGSALLSAQSVLWFNEGPLGVVNGFSMGSGVLDQAQLATGSALPYGNLRGFDDRLGPVWHPSDNTSFRVPKQLVTGSVSRMIGITVPVGMYGRRIVPNSLRLICNTYDDTDHGLIRTLIDDGRGGLFLSGSAATNYGGAVRSTGTYSIAPANTSSVSFESRFLGPITWSILASVPGMAGNHAWSIDESNPASVTITVPCFSDGATPSETMWSFYQFMATSSIYIRPTAITAPNDITGFVSFTMNGGASANPAAKASGSYRGVEWNKVGNVFYDEGLVVIKDPALLDFGASWPGVSDHPSDLLQTSFRGESRIPVKTLMCRIDRGDLNSSLNQTLYETETDGSRVRVHPSGNLYVSTVGIYNSDRELVGIARLAEPLRVRPRDRMNVKLRMDF